MSGIFDSRFKYLDATLSSPVALSKYRLVTAWVKWSGTQFDGRIPFQFDSPDGFMRMELVPSTGMRAHMALGGAPANTSNGTPIVTGTWTPIAEYVENGTSGFIGYGSDINGSRTGGTYSVGGTPTNAFNFLRIAQGGNVNEFSNWEGRIAHVAVWSLDNLTDVQNVMTQLLTVAPTSVSGFTPVWYASLNTDATATGGTVTTNGSPTYDGADNPTFGGGDTTAPVLTTAVGTATGSTTATVGATTDEANGTMYVVVTTSATQPSVAQIKAGQNNGGTAAAYASSQTITTTGAKTFSATGLTASTTYYAHHLHTDAATNDSNRITSSSFTTTTPDVTAPTLSSGVGTVKSNALIVVGATTNEANGTMYVVVTTSATPPSAAQVKLGQNNGGTAAVFAANQAIGSTGAKTFNATGLTQLTGYYPYIVHTDAAGNDSSVLSIGLRTTFRNGATGQSVVDDTAAIPGVQEQGFLYNDVTLPADADKWFSYTIATPAVDSASLTLYANGSFIWVGLASDSFTYQLEVDGANVGSPALVTLTASGADVTAPTLSSATGTKTGTSTATGTVTTNEANGTLYYLTNTSASATGAAVLAGSTQTVTTSGVQNISRSGLSAATTYYHHYLHRDAAGNDSSVLSSNSFTTDAAADVTPPTLTSPTGATLGPTGAVGSVSTNEANGTLYWLTNTSATATDAAIKAANSQPVTATGVQNVTSSGLIASTVYYNHFLHRDAAGNDSTRSTSASFTTAAPGGPVTGNDHGGEAMRSAMRPAMYFAMNQG